jgi:hypothetical protein
VSGKNLESGAADCAQGVHRKCRKGGAVLSSQFSVLSSRFSVLGSRSSLGVPPRFAWRDSRGGWRYVSWGEPRQKALVELLWGCAYGSAVIGVGDFPENCVAISRFYSAGMANRYVAVDLTVNQEDWDLCGCHGIFWRDLLHVEMVLGADVEESEFDYGAEEGASEPGAQVEGLAHAVIGDLSETGERRFGGYGAEVRFDGEGLQEFGSAHRFGESENATRMVLRGEEVEPLVNVIAFEEAVGGEWASACAVGAGVGEQNRESVSEEELRVSGHADAIVGEAVEEDYGVPVAAVRADFPGTEDDGVRGGDGNVFESGIEVVGDVAHGGFRLGC